MDPLLLELAKLQKDGNLKQSIDDVDKIIEQLEKARETIVAGKRPTSIEPEVAGREAWLYLAIADFCQIQTLPLLLLRNCKIHLNMASIKLTMTSRRCTEGIMRTAKL